MKCAAALAYDSKNSNSKMILPDPDCISVIEKEIDMMEATLPSIEKLSFCREGIYSYHIVI